mmetsp:Transcript_38216/g.80405  ORF Transcript_38216/g.80405 Transcript_38216/m.80405 type:complete len:178 (-) Transcript_38216:2413-2946(-)
MPTTTMSSAAIAAATLAMAATVPCASAAASYASTSVFEEPGGVITDRVPHASPLKEYGVVMIPYPNAYDIYGCSGGYYDAETDTYMLSTERFGELNWRALLRYGLLLWRIYSLHSMLSMFALFVVTWNPVKGTCYNYDYDESGMLHHARVSHKTIQCYHQKIPRRPLNGKSSQDSCV